MNTAGSAPFVLAPDEGQSFWYLGGVATFKITNEQTGSWGLSVETFPAGFASAFHNHPTEDSGFYVLIGEMRVKCGDLEATARPGMFVFLPRGVPHAFKVGETGPVTWINVQGPTGDFRRLTEEIGEPAPGPVLPPAGIALPDAAATADAARRHNLERLGPSPFDI